MVSVIQSLVVVIERPGVIVLIVPAVLVRRIVAIVLPVVVEVVGVGVTKLLRVKREVSRLALIRLINFISQPCEGRAWSFLLTALHGEPFDGSALC